MLCYNKFMIIYFDTETTGLRPGHIIQLSYIIDDGKIIEGKNFYFYTDYIEESAINVHGITVEKLLELSNGKRFYDYINEIERDFNSADLIIAHNINFDHKFMCAEFENNFKTYRPKDCFDTMAYFSPVLKLPRPNGRGIKPPKLSELCQAMDVYPFEAERLVKQCFNKTDSKFHDATYDTASMFLAVNNACQKIPELKNYLSEFLQTD